MKKKLFGILGLALLPLVAWAASETRLGYDKVTVGNSTLTNKELRLNVGLGASNPGLRGNQATGKTEFWDGSQFKPIGSGSGSGGGVVLNENFGFEDGTTGWTASGGTFAVTSTAADVAFGAQAASWTPSGAQTLAYTALLVPSGLYGKICTLSWVYKGGDANYVFEVTDGTNTLATSSATSAQTLYSSKQVLYFNCPSSGNVIPRARSTGAAAQIFIDEFKIGQENVLATGANDTDWVSFSPGTQGFGTPSVLQVEWRRQGDSIDIRGRVTVGTTTATEARVNLPAGLTVDSSKIPARKRVGSWIFEDVTTGNVEFTVMAEPSVSHLTFGFQSNGGGTYGNVKQNGSAIIGSGFTFVFYAYGVPITQWSNADRTQVVTVDQAGWRVDANIGGSANPAMSTGAVSSYTEITDANLDIVAASGSAAVEIPCSGTNPSTGLTCAAGNEGLGVVFTPPTAGVYDVCAAFTHNRDIASGAIIDTAFQLIETPNNAQTILQEGNGRAVDGQQIGTSALVKSPFRVCGTFTFSSNSKRTIRLMYEQATTGTINAVSISADRSASVGQRDVQISVRRRVEYQDAVKFTNLVTASSYPSGLKVETVQFGGASEKSNCTTSPCTIYRQSGGFSSVSRSSTGQYTLNISGGIFSAAPTCTVTCGQTSGSLVITTIDGFPSASSSTSFKIGTLNASNLFIDAGCNAQCIGF